MVEEKSSTDTVAEVAPFSDALLQNIPGFAYRCVFDADWTMRFVSEGSLRVTGYAPEVLMGEEGPTFDGIIDPRDRCWVRDHVDRCVARGEPFQFTYRIHTADGDIRWVWEEGRLAGEEGGERLLDGYIADVTAVREMEREHARTKQLGHAGVMAASIAHDIANLLQVVQLTVEKLKRQNQSTESTDDLLVMEDALRRSALLVAELRSAGSSNEHSRLRIDRAIQALEPMLQRMGAEVTLVLAADTVWVRLGSMQLDQLVINLVSNAAEANAAHIRVLTSVDGDVVNLEVWDDGEGIPPQLLESVFETHFTTKASGTGLGLQIVRRVVERAGGEIDVQSVAGNTRFRVRLPTIQPPTRARALLLEPNVVVRRVAAARIAELGLEVLACASTHEAESLLTHEQGEVSLFVTGVLATPETRAFESRVRDEHPDIDVLSLDKVLAQLP